MGKKSAPKKSGAARITRSTDAAGADLGFSLQRTRFLARLLEARAGDNVCLEVFDDVRLEKSDGTVIAEEDKSTHGRNPIADRSIDLWKTLANWVNAAAAGNIDPSTTSFEVYVSRPVTGQFSTWFHDTQTEAEAKASLLNVRNELWGNSPEYSKRPEVAEGIAPYLDEVFGSDFEIAISIVARLEFHFGSGDQHADLRPLFCQELVSEDALDDVSRWAHGWVKIKLDRLSEKSIPAVIAKSEFHAALLNYVRHHDRVDILRSFASDPSPSEIADQQFKTYVRQLEIVDADDVDILAAVNEFLRSTADRITWADRGFVDDESLLAFEKGLQRTWKNTKSQVSLEQKALSDAEQGMLILLKCLEHKAKLDGLAVPEHFVPGSFHALANATKLGWHPAFRDALKRYSARKPMAFGGMDGGS